MAGNTFIEHFEIRNEDVTLRFTCPNYRKRINECVSNLLIDLEKPETLTFVGDYRNCSKCKMLKSVIWLQ